MLTIDEAINTLSELLQIVFIAKNPERNSAVKLGIEALKWIKWRRENYHQPPILPLPGETEE